MFDKNKFKMDVSKILQKIAPATFGIGNKVMHKQYSIEKLVDMANDGEFRELGNGRTRTTYDLEDGTVLKVLECNETGMSTDMYKKLNQIEFNHYQKYGDVFPLAKAIKVCEKTGGLVMEKAISVGDYIWSLKEENPKKFKDIAEAYNDISDNIESLIRNPILCKLFNINETLLEAIEDKTILRRRELSPLFNWGVTKDGRLVMIDYCEYDGIYDDSSYHTSMNSGSYDYSYDNSYDDSCDFYDTSSSC